MKLLNLVTVCVCVSFTNTVLRKYFNSNQPCQRIKSSWKHAAPESLYCQLYKLLVNVKISTAASELFLFYLNFFLNLKVRHIYISYRNKKNLSPVPAVKWDHDRSILEGGV